MKVTNMTSSRGNKVANQFIVHGAAISDPNPQPNLPQLTLIGTMFQSYSSNIAFIIAEGLQDKTYIDERYWDYSVTTGKYRNQFLGETKKETQAKIDSGKYILTNLN
jgi:hypothetical protein